MHFIYLLHPERTISSFNISYFSFSCEPYWPSWTRIRTVVQHHCGTGTTFTLGIRYLFCGGEAAVEQLSLLTPGGEERLEDDH
jgi:hypothetical protein